MEQAPKLGRPKKRDEVGRWLKAYLAHGPKSQNAVEKAGKAMGFSMRTLERAKANQGFESIRRGQVYFWQDPDVLTEQMGSANLVEAIDRLSRQIARLARGPAANPTPPTPTETTPTWTEADMRWEWDDEEIEAASRAKLIEYANSLGVTIAKMEKEHGTSVPGEEHGDVETVDNTTAIARRKRELMRVLEAAEKKSTEEF